MNALPSEPKQVLITGISYRPYALNIKPLGGPAHTGVALPSKLGPKPSWVQELFKNLCHVMETSPEAEPIKHTHTHTLIFLSYSLSLLLKDGVHLAASSSDSVTYEYTHFDVTFNILLLPHICTWLFIPYQFCKLGQLISVCQFLSRCVNSLSIKAYVLKVILILTTILSTK